MAWPSLGLVWSPELELSYLAQAPAGKAAQDLLASGLEWKLEFSAFINLCVPWKCRGPLERQIPWWRGSPGRGTRGYCRCDGVQGGAGTAWSCWERVPGSYHSDWEFPRLPGGGGFPGGRTVEIRNLASGPVMQTAWVRFYICHSLSVDMCLCVFVCGVYVCMCFQQSKFLSYP